MTAARNPFCAAHFAPGVLPWIGELDVHVDRACRAGARLQVLGPHGSGKSSLLVHLARLAERRGWEACSLRGSQGLAALDRSPGARPLIVFADEAEELGTARLLALRAWCRWRSASLVVTAHRDLGLETLCERTVDASTVRILVDRLLDGSSPAPLVTELDELLRHHRGNVREVFFDLYDRVSSSVAIARVRT